MPTNNTKTLPEENIIDDIINAHPELGPSVPDGGYGWIIFITTLFFHTVLPSLTVSFGIYVAFDRLVLLDNANPLLWDSELLYVPLFYTVTIIFVAPNTKSLVFKSTWPRLVTIAGVCLTCAGMLFMWMGQANFGSTSALFIISGVLTGLGSGIQLSQCEMLLFFYFKSKYTILKNVTEIFTILGFIAAPMILAPELLKIEWLKVTLWYQAIIIQGLILSLFFKKPPYLKSKSTPRPYRFLSNDEEEAVFYKTSRELQIKNVDKTITKQIPIDQQPSTSQHPTLEEELKQAGPETKKNWIQFEEEETIQNSPENNNQNWVQFENEEENKTIPEEPTPLPLFTSGFINNNTSYSFDDEVPAPTGDAGKIFQPAPKDIAISIASRFSVLKELSFYKSLLTVCTYNFSKFSFYCLFPSYLFVEVEVLKFREAAIVVGLLSITSLMVYVTICWVHVSASKRPIVLWVSSWIGAFGYFVLTDSRSEVAYIIGGILICATITVLKHLTVPLIGFSIKGEHSKHFWLMNQLSGLSFLFLIFLNISIKDCFRLTAVLQFMSGSVWFSNFIYKKIKIMH